MSGTRAIGYDGDLEDFEELKRGFRCDRCAAEPGAPCHDRSGKRVSYGSHASRHNQAWTLIRFAAQPPTDRQTRLAAKLAAAWQ